MTFKSELSFSMTKNKHAVLLFVCTDEWFYSNLDIKKGFLACNFDYSVIQRLFENLFVGSMDRESSQQLQMWFSEHFFAPKLAL